MLLALAIGSFLESGISSALLKKMSPAAVVRVGLFLEFIGVLAMTLGLTSQATWTFLVPCLFVYGLGVGLATAQLTGVILQEIPQELTGQGSGTQSTARQIGAALGIAILGTVLFTFSAAAFDRTLTDELCDLPDNVRNELVTALDRSAGAARPSMTAESPEVGAAAADAFTTGTKLSAGIGAAFLAMGFATTFRLHSRRAEHCPRRSRGLRPGNGVNAR